MAFDIEKQTCDWKASVKNCELKTKEKKVKPLLFTDEPICQENHLACGDGNCIERGLFCNGQKECNDGSDENACGKDKYCIGCSPFAYVSSVFQTLKPIPTELLLVILPSVNCPTASARRMAPKFLENFAMLDPLDPTAKMFLKWS